MANRLIESKSKDTAIRLLGSAEKLGLDRKVVKSVYNGFLVPEEVAKEFEAADKPKTTRKKATAKKAPADDTKEGTD